jgi:hypothetical protein
MISNHDVMSFQVNKGKKEQKEQQQEEPEQSTDLEGSEQDYDSTSASPVTEDDTGPIREQESSEED